MSVMVIDSDHPIFTHNSIKMRPCSCASHYAKAIIANACGRPNKYDKVRVEFVYHVSAAMKQAIRKHLNKRIKEIERKWFG